MSRRPSSRTETRSPDLPSSILIWGLPIKELYTSGPYRPLIRYPSQANLSVIFRSKVE
jgi:hypothetical protein